MKPPIKRIAWEYNKLAKELAESRTLIDGEKRSKEEFIRVHNSALWEYLSSIYSYENNCAIKIFSIEEAAKSSVLQKIENEYSHLANRAKFFGLDDIEIGEFYLSKIDNLDENLGYRKIWYVHFKEAHYPFGFDQSREYIATVKSNAFLMESLLILRGQSNMLPGMKDAFLVDFGLTKEQIKELSNYEDMLGLFDLIKLDGELDLKTSERTLENPIASIPAGKITFSTPTHTSGDIDDFDMDDDVAQMIDGADSVSKIIEYCTLEESGYKECGKIGVSKGSKSIRVLGRMSDIALIALSETVARKIYGLQSGKSNLSNINTDQ